MYVQKTGKGNTGLLLGSLVGSEMESDELWKAIPVGPVFLGWGPSDTGCSEPMLSLHNWSLSYAVRLYFFQFSAFFCISELPQRFTFVTVCCLSTVLAYLLALIFLHPSQVLHWQALYSIKKVQYGGDD